MHPARAALVWLTLFTSALATASDVIIVDANAGAGSDATTLQAGVDMAPPGATVLVRDGAYGPVIITKSVHLVADAAASVTAESIKVQNIAAEQCVTVRGVDATPLLSIGGPAVFVEDALGAVFFEDSSFTVDLSEYGLSIAGQVIDSDDVTFVDCELIGGISFGVKFQSPGIGLSIADSDVVLANTTVRGEAGVVGLYSTADGAPAMTVARSNVFIGGATIVGGTGGDTTFCFESPGHGAHGIQMFDSTNSLHIVDSFIAGGSGGLALCGGNDGINGSDIFNLGQAPVVKNTNVSLPTLTTTSPLRTGETGAVTVDGAPSMPLFLALSFQLSSVPIFSLHGVLAGGAMPTIITLGAVPATGTHVTTFQAPALPVGFESVPVVLQSAVRSPTTNQAVLSNPSQLMLLTVASP